MASKSQHNLAEAKAHLSELVDRALSGDEVVIARAGRPVVRLVPIQPRPPVVYGDLAGKVEIPDDLTLPPEVVEDFYR